MSENRPLEERVDELERELAFVKQRVAKPLNAADWLNNISGSMKQFPEFPEVVALGAEFRRSQADVCSENEG